MAYKYVNIDPTYTSTGTGTSPSPYNWDQFISNISAVKEDTIYRLKGHRDTSGTYYISGSSQIDIDITNWEGQEGENIPWSIKTHDATDCDINFYVYGNDVNFRNGRIEQRNASLINWYSDGSLEKLSFIETQFLYISSASEFYEIPKIDFKNCSIKLNKDETYPFLFFYTTNNAVEIRCDIYNSILCGNTNARFFRYYYGANPVVATSFIFDFNNVVVHENVSASQSADFIIDKSSSTLTPKFSATDIAFGGEYLSDSVIYGTTKALSAITSADLNYTNAPGISAITLSGDSSLSATYRTHIFGGTVDGVGALYFPTIIAYVSAENVSGDTPFERVVSASLSGECERVLSYTFNFEDDSSVSSTSDTKVTHNFQSIGKWDIDLDVRSLNGWYTIDARNTFLLSAFSSYLSATVIFVNVDTSALATSAYINNAIAISASYLSGSPTEYDILWGDGTSAEEVTLSNNVLYYEHTYDTKGPYNVSAIIRNNADQSFTSIYELLNIYDASTRVIYVDVARNYDTTATNAGTSANPLDYGEFIAYIISGGTWVYNDVYKLKGYRELTAASEVIETIPDANLVIDAWDLSAYGPWFICKNDLYSTNKLAFHGCDLRNGIIYNKPYLLGSIYKGSILGITKTHDMYIVCQGNDSYVDTATFEFSGAKHGVNLIGSTIYSQYGYKVENEFDTLSMSADITTFNSVDSVIVGFDVSGAVSAVSLNVYGSVFNVTSASISADFHGFNINRDNQYEWTAPISYPLTREAGNSYGYEKDLDWLSANRGVLKPFDNITTPPNPGYYYDEYTNYEKGLFGNSRKDYIRRS